MQKKVKSDLIRLDLVIYFWNEIPENRKRLRKAGKGGIMFIKEKIDEILEEVINIRREFHMYPELSEMEFETQERICKYLEKWNIEYERGIAETGVVAVIRGEKPGKTIGIRADIDALPIWEENDLPFKSKNPGVMHACGHDVHTAIGLGLGRMFKDMVDQLEGNIKIFFQPAEETIGGADRMIGEGVLENPTVDHILGLHVSPAFQVGEMEIKRGRVNAATNEFTIEISGKSGHAAYPEKTVDAILISANIILAIQSLVSRNTSPLNPIVVSLGKINGGVKNNIIPDLVTLSGTLRTLDEETREFGKKRLAEIAKSVAQVYGGDAQVHFPTEGAFVPLINDDYVANKVIRIGREVLGLENVYYKEKPSMGGDDFSFFAREVPSAYYYLGCGNVEKGYDSPAHNENFMIDEGCIKYGLEIQMRGVLSLLGVDL